MKRDFKFSTLAQLEAFLYELRNRGSKYSLDRMFELCSALGNPQEKFLSVHVAGTNGKGSVCAMLERMLSDAGFKCGMYTSPHLVYLGERIKFCSNPVSKEELLGLMQRVSETAEELFGSRGEADKPSFFEYMTAAAFLYFAEKKADFAVVETGLGGRLDATNILKKPALCAITSISLDHTEFLGDTIEKIAAEKAGIIKPGTDVVCGFMPCAARAVISAAAERAGARAVFAEDIFPDASSMPQTSLGGFYQLKNSATALLCSRILNENGTVEISEAAALDSLKKVSWPARWQRIDLPENGSFMILDASHNIEGAEELARNLDELARKYPDKKIVVSVGSLESGRAKALLKAVGKYASRVVLLVPENPRALPFEKLESLLPENFPPHKRGKVKEMFPRPGFCSEIGSGEILVSTGSIYLAGEILAALRGQEADNLCDILRPEK